MNLNKQFFKKHWSNIVFAIAIVLLLIPQTGTPIKVAFNKLFAFSPGQLDNDQQTQLDTYNWPLKTLSGQEVNLAISKDKVVLINLWATWCPPCIAEMPSLQTLYDSFGDRVDFYLVTNEDPAKVQAFINKKGYTFPVYIQQYSAPETLVSTALPTTYVIDKNAMVVIKETGAANWNAESVQELLQALLVAPIH